MRFGGIVLATVLVLAACSSDPAPREPDPPASSAPATPTVAAPTMPPQASEDSPEGAAAFVKHYVDLFNYAAATGDVKELSDAAPNCDPCQKYARDLSSLRKSERATGKAWTLGDVSVADSDEGRSVLAEITVLDDSNSPYQLAFAVTREVPYAVVDIFDRGQR